MNALPCNRSAELIAMTRPAPRAKDWKASSWNMGLPGSALERLS